MDALDECLDWDELLKILRTLQSSCGSLKVFASSRREYGLSITLTQMAAHDFVVRNAAVDADIGVYVQSRLGADHELSKWPTSIKSEIEEALVAGSHGM